MKCKYCNHSKTEHREVVSVKGHILCRHLRPNEINPFGGGYLCSCDGKKKPEWLK